MGATVVVMMICVYENRSIAAIEGIGWDGVGLVLSGSTTEGEFQSLTKLLKRQIK